MTTLNDHTFLPLEANSIVFDLGANLGWFAKSILNKYPDCKVISFEPVPNILKSDDPRWTVIEQAVNNHTGTVQFYIAKDNFNSSLVFSKGGYAIMVSCMSLTDILDTYCPYPDLVKMDIEGGEWMVLMSTPEHTLKKINQLSVEFHDFLDKSKLEMTMCCIKRLKSIGFELRNHRGIDYRHGSEYTDCLFVNTD